MEINNIKVDYFLKKIIDDNDVKVFEKYIKYVIDNNLNEEFDNMNILGLSIVQYVCKMGKEKLLKILFQNSMNLNSYFSDEIPVFICINNKHEKLLNILLKYKGIHVSNNKSSIYIELAKANMINYISRLLKNNYKVDSLLDLDEKSNNLLFYIDNNYLSKKIINFVPKILKTTNWNNDNIILHYAKIENYEMTLFILKSKLSKINQLNYQDNNIVHLIIKNKWFNLIELIGIKKIKKEMNICNIDGMDFFLLLLINSDDIFFKKYSENFYNINLIEYYIDKVCSFDHDKIVRFISFSIKKMSDNEVIHLFINLIEESKNNEALVLLEMISEFKSKNFCDLLWSIYKKYLDYFFRKE